MITLRELQTHPDRACKDAPTDLFFVPEFVNGHAARNMTQQAKEICSTCPVRLACAAFGLENREFGVWGGLDDEDRRRLRRRQSCQRLKLAG